jgi:tRNA(Ile)-lysidine synthase
LLNYTRNKIRLDLIPKLKEDFNPSIEEAILRTAKLIYGADSVIRELVKKYMVSIVTDVTTDKICIKVPILQTHSDFMQGEIIQSAWMKYFRLLPLSLNAIDRIIGLCEKQTGTQIEIGAGFIALKDRNLIIITRNSIFKQVKLFGTIPSEFRINGYKVTFTKVDKKSVKITDNPNIEYFDFDKLGTYVEIRNWEQGDLFHPLGAPGEMKVSDFLTNEKISMLDKPNIIIVRNAYDTVWVIGKRISDKYKIDGNTRSIIKAEIITIK